MTAEEVEAGRWGFDPFAAAGLGLDPDYAEEHLRYYTKTLEQGGKYILTIWPFHAMLGGIGHALVSALEEALFFHSVVRRAPLDFQPKGDNALTEHYSMLGPEVSTTSRVSRSASAPSADRAPAPVRRVVIAGEAKPLRRLTIEDLLSDPTVQERGLEEKVYLLEDCTSPVVVPGTVDYTDEADAHFARFAESGAHVVRSDQPLEEWPGVVGESVAAAG